MITKKHKGSTKNRRQVVLLHYLVTTGVWSQANGTALLAAPDGGHPGPVLAMALQGQRAEWSQNMTAW